MRRALSVSEKTEHRKSSGLGPYGGNIVNNTPTNIFEKSKVRKYHSETQEKKEKAMLSFKFVDRSLGRAKEGNRSPVT